MKLQAGFWVGTSSEQDAAAEGVTSACRCISFAARSLIIWKLAAQAAEAQQKACASIAAAAADGDGHHISAAQWQAMNLDLAGARA